MFGYISNKEEWLYPDMPMKELDNKIAIHTAKNGCESVKLLLKSNAESINVTVDEHSNFEVEIFEMLDVYVGYNEIEKEVQDGQFVITEKEYEKPEYCTRKAPFRVYEALKPIKDIMYIKKNIAPICITIQPKEHVTPGVSEIKLIIKDKTPPHKEECLHIEVNVYDVQIPHETLKITNWFNLDNISTYHGDLPLESKAYYDQLRAYAKVMRRLRQTHFYIMLDPRKVFNEKGTFDFTYYKPIIEIFFQEGFETMELGPFLEKTPTLFTEELKCSFDKRLCISSDEGFYQMVDFIQEVKHFLEKNNWVKNTIFHICDEPDVHVENDHVLAKRKEDYFKVANLLKKAIPSCKIVEAVKSTEFKSAIDIWVPLTSTYEEFRESFNKMQSLGDEVWCYVCCVPTGYHLNRFLDIDLVKSRLLFWGISKFTIEGYLHWGLNQQPRRGFNVFENSNTPNEAFNGIFPSGDAFMVYPYNDQILMGMRFEAQRRGAEDYELLKVLKEKNKEAYDEIIGSTITSFSQYHADIDNFEQMRIKLLKELEKSNGMRV
ncbi:DUF4091 domain-containing protein [Vallitalea okinawensis]|uniref:DUF4091 domain-containing protein n=1 Tax=Vallitalea okinawensis TaxID=2078660 RepID=UPI000CFCE646|nr:DUF4091 domain-containing protein [Vallitalea okinawensis]